MTASGESTSTTAPPERLPAIGPGRAARMMGVIAWPVAAVAVLLVLWEGGVRLLRVPSFVIPAPSGVFAETWEWRYRLIEHTAVTLYETLAGFGLSIVVALPLATAIVYSRVARKTIYPILVILQSVPKVAIAPLLLLVMGAGLSSKVAIAFLVAFFPLVVSTATGLAGTSSELLDLGRVYKASRLKVFLRVRFPMALPHVFAGLRIAITLAVIGAVVGEFVGSQSGLGYIIVTATAYWNAELAFGAILILSVMGVLLFEAVGVAERVLCPWYTDVEAR